MRELPVSRAGATSANGKSPLKLIFLNDLSDDGRAQGIVFGDAVEDGFPAKPARVFNGSPVILAIMPEIEMLGHLFVDA